MYCQTVTKVEVKIEIKKRTCPWDRNKIKQNYKAYTLMYHISFTFNYCLGFVLALRNQEYINKINAYKDEAMIVVLLSYFALT